MSQSTTIEQKASKSGKILKQLKRDLAIMIAKAQRQAAREGARFPQTRFQTGPFTVPTGTPQRPRGRHGVPRDSFGSPETEVNPELYPHRARGLGDDPGIFHEMMLTDGTIAGVLEVVKREIKRVPRVIVGPVDPTPAESRAVQLAERFFGLGRYQGTGGWLEGGLGALIGNLLDALGYGFSAFEVLASTHDWIDGAVVMPDRVQRRAQRSVWGWTWQRDRLAGLVQLQPVDASQAVTFPDLRIVSESLNRIRSFSRGLSSLIGAETVSIPADRLLLYSHNGGPDRPEGLSVIRSSYVWWKAKQDVLLLYMSAMETLFSGMTTLRQRVDAQGRPYESVSDQDLDDWSDLFSAWMRGDVDWVVEALGWEIERKFPGFDIPTPEKVLEYFNSEIRVSFSAMLFGLGARTAGSLSDAFGQAFYNTLASIASDIAEVINGRVGEPWTGLVRRLVDWNVPESTDPTFRYPELRFVGLRHQDPQGRADTITKLLQYLGIKPTVDLEVGLRREFELPEIDPSIVAMKKRAEVLTAELELERLEEGQLPGEVDSPGEEEPGDQADESRLSEEGTQAPVMPPASAQPADEVSEDD